MASQYFTLTDGHKLPPIGLGTFTITNEQELETALDVALETGYRHIDTALFYRNEHIIGKVLKKWFNSGKLKREDVFVTTKLPGCQPPEKVEFYVKKSLEDLQLDYIDLYLIHSPICFDIDSNLPFNKMKLLPSDLVATYKKMEELVERGLCKTIGISNFNQRQVKKILDNAKIIPATNQVELHIYLQQPELVKFCQDNGIVMVSYLTFGNPGLGKWLESNNMPARNYPDILNDPTVKKIADKHKKTTAQVLLKFMIQKNIAVIPKSVTPSRIRENFNIFDFTLDKADITEMEKLDKGEAGRNTWFDYNEDYEFWDTEEKYHQFFIWGILGTDAYTHLGLLVLVMSNYSRSSCI
ncbi:hypothetical protein ABEB36_004137 [Hypothenemus hampei]|uniref:NADP-dependent oxidoreductase domain-containing protein n=1 Tax=Hypothenemus hampei TaxID=57062 RepID=A0ABD1F2B2_HYPHA